MMRNFLSQSGVLNSSRRGSALLIALLVMGILLTLSVGLSELVVREIRVTSQVVDSGKAYFAAEAGIENALLELHQNLPGFETEEEGTEVILKKDDEVKTNYKVLNQTQIFPFRDQEEEDWNSFKSIGKWGVFYEELPLNESMTIPLFAYKDGKVQNIDKFRLEYYVDYNTSLGQFASSDLDVLRWKLFGINKQTGKTEALSDYFPVSQTSSGKQPMCLGNDMTSVVQGDLEARCNPSFVVAGQKAREYYEYKSDGTNVHYTTSDKVVTAPKGTVSLANPAQPTLAQPLVSDASSGNALVLDPGVVGGSQPAGLTGYSIQQFMETHKNVYLTITNIINPRLIYGDSMDVKKKIAKIKYRLVAFDDKKTVREYATIRSDGFYKDLRQSIDVKLRLDQFLPVFNFSLYRTDVSK